MRFIAISQKKKLRLGAINSLRNMTQSASGRGRIHNMTQQFQSCPLICLLHGKWKHWASDLNIRFLWISLARDHGLLEALAPETWSMQSEGSQRCDHFSRQSFGFSASYCSGSAIPSRGLSAGKAPSALATSSCSFGESLNLGSFQRIVLPIFRDSSIP